MNKTERLDLIREIIRTERLQTQSDLVSALRGRGVACTQATVSRDVRELRLTKLQSPDGKFYYAEPASGEPPVVSKLLEAFTSGYLSADFSGNMVVVRTVVGMAPACALALDAVQWQGVVGTIAGDDTIMVVTRSVSASKKIVKKLESLINQ